MATLPSVYPADLSLIQAPHASLGDVVPKYDSKEYRYLGALAHRYSDLLRETESDVLLVNELGAVVYLIDADVVRNLVERRYHDSRVRREAHKLFESPHFKYALPIGAFQEVLEWIRKFSPEHIPFVEPKTSNASLSRDHIIRELARGCNVSWSDSDDDEAIVSRVLEALGENNTTIERLISFFTNPRFEGVVATYQLEEAAKCYRVLRGSAETVDRMEQDLKDAVNLSLVFDSIRKRRQQTAINDSVEPCYVLITETRTLIDLPDQPLDDFLVSELSELNGVRGPVPKNIFPVMTPRRAFMVENVRKQLHADQSGVNWIRQERRVYDELGDLLRAQKDSGVLSLAPRLQRNLTHLQSIYFGEDMFFRLLEHERATLDSIKYLEAKHKVKRGEKLDVKALQAATLSFFRLLHQFHMIAGQAYPARYELSEVDDEVFPELTYLRVLSQTPSEVLLEGELYKSNATLTAYSVRWSTGCSEQDFFSALARILTPTQSQDQKQTKFSLRRLSETSEEWNEGLIVFTSRGIYGTTLRQQSLRWLWKNLSVEMIVAAIELLASTEDITHHNLFASELQETTAQITQQAAEGIGIIALRISTSFAHFQIDILPSDESDRYVSVISHKNVSTQISYLCESTSLYPVLAVKLNEIISSFTSRFPST